MDEVRELVLARGIMREGLGRENGGEDLVMVRGCVLVGDISRRERDEADGVWMMDWGSWFMGKGFGRWGIWDGRKVMGM